MSIKQHSYVPLLTYALFLFGVDDTLFYLFHGYLPQVFSGVNFLGVISQPSLALGLTINCVGILLTGLALAGKLQNG
jgi:hypothetical protein